MKLTPIDPKEAFALTPSQRQSFAGMPLPYRISGPPGLARLVGPQEQGLGFFWFEEPVFTQLREKAKADLEKQRPPAGGGGAKPSRELVGLYMKFCLRDELAVSKDWKPIFDGYAILPLRPVDTLIAWVGQIKGQPYYSKPSPTGLTKTEYQDALRVYEAAESNGVSLPGLGKQYVINFDHPVNKPLAKRILGPWPF